KTGAWAGPINAHLKPQEIQFIVSNSEAGTIVTQPDLYPNLSETLLHAASLRNVIVIEDSSQWSVVRRQRATNGELYDMLPAPSKPIDEATPEQLTTDNRQLATVSSDDEAVIIYTSGTT